MHLPAAVEAAGPAIPFQSPNILGDPQLTIEPFTEIADLQACLALGQTVYGIALQNTNVRQAPDLDACRVGRIPRGTLVAVTAVITKSNPITLDIAPVPEYATAVITAVAGVVDQTTAITSSASTQLPTLRPTAEPPRNSATAPTAGDDVDESLALGYVEDVQPIFQRNCIACHSAVVKQKNLQVTAYDPLMQGGVDGPVVLPGNAEESILWNLVSTGKMPLIGQLTLAEKETIRRWIEDGALERRFIPAGGSEQVTAAATVKSAPAVRDAQSPTTTTAMDASAVTANAELWLTVDKESIDPVPDLCAEPAEEPQQVVSADLILPISCGVAPRAAQVQSLLQSLSIIPAAPRPLVSTGSAAPSVIDNAAPSSAVDNAPAAAPVSAAPQAGLQSAALGLSAPSDSDTWLTPRGGFCLDPHFTQNNRGITALAFAPDGRLFVALDARLDEQPDINVLYDAYHPSRSIVVYDPSTRFSPNEIMSESSRITGMTYANGALCLNRAGEVGWIQDGGQYRTLAGGFAVNSQLFHANNGIVVNNGYLYVSAGG
ncbi:MAG: hypothetical protein KDE31_27450, partial [Caldilineaceae bacterium]|nr:hypothetical protein [Caldilineaceae bacterium]